MYFICFYLETFFVFLADITEMFVICKGINMAEYVVSGARISCTFGTTPATLNVVVPKGVTLGGKNIATSVDCVPLVNIGCFGKCNVVPAAPKPCTPGGVWMNTSMTVKACEIPVLTKDSCMMCAAGGGMISIKSSGQ